MLGDLELSSNIDSVMFDNMSCIEPEQTKAKTVEVLPQDFSIEQVLDWLSSRGFPETGLNSYKEAFKSNGIDGGMLEELTDDLL